MYSILALVLRRYLKLCLKMCNLNFWNGMALVPVAAKLDLYVLNAPTETKTLIEAQAPALKRQARIEAIQYSPEAPKGSIQIVSQGITYALPVADVIDLAAEVARLEKAIGKTEGELKKASGKLANERFVANAPEEVVVQERERVAAFTAELEQLQAAKARLQNL